MCNLGANTNNSMNLVDELGSEIRDAVVAVLKDQTEPAIALAELLDDIQGP